MTESRSLRLALDVFHLASKRVRGAEDGEFIIPPAVARDLRAILDKARELVSDLTPKKDPEPVDETKTDTTDGQPLDTTIGPSGQQKNYLVLSEEERARGFVRPVRRTYKHVGMRPTYPLRDLTDEERATHGKYGYDKVEDYPESERPRVGRFWSKRELESGCGKTTTMSADLAETYARSPRFYGATFCAHCGNHYPVGAGGEFVWVGADGADTDQRVGT